MSSMEIYMICAAAVLISMQLGSVFEGRCEKNDAMVSEIDEIKKRLSTLEEKR